MQSLLAAFAELNRRRLFGSPPLEVAEMEAWAQLRGRLEAHFASQAGSSHWHGLERRDFERWATHIQLHFGRQQALVPAAAGDISEGGLFIATRHPLDEGSLLALLLTDAAQGHFEVRARVRWLRRESGPQGPAGMGVAFIDLEPDQRRRLDSLIRGAARDPSRGAS